MFIITNKSNHSCICNANVNYIKYLGLRIDSQLKFKKTNWLPSLTPS